jgi:pyruvate kinase
LSCLNYKIAEQNHRRGSLYCVSSTRYFYFMKAPGISAGRDIMLKEDAIRFLFNLAFSMKEQEQVFEDVLGEIHPSFQTSARNLLHYLVLRSEEIRPLQQYLHNCGLSSLTSSESHTLSQLIQVMRWLDPYLDGTPLHEPALCTFDNALSIRRKHLVKLLGSNLKKDLPHIMVTLSAELAEDTDRIEQLLDSGMTVVRINCGHGGPPAWLNMIQKVRETSAKVGKSCKIYMDLSGPRIRISDVPIKAKISTEGLVLNEGDILELSEQKNHARKARRRWDGTLKSPARIVIQPQGLLGMLKVGERIFFDDGKFEARIIQLRKKKVVLVVTRISTRNPVLRAGKGVNLPDSDLKISSLTDEDIEHLPFIAEHADLIGYSFVSGPDDVRMLREKLQVYPHNVPAIILKIERLSAVQNLPGLLLEGMKDQSLGVMIARGDLAVEIGFERLSEIQQEILWICEAAHVPVIWATQVLESMNKSGFATRSEITDAAMGGMAECVMLNKGKHVVKTVQTLVDILKRFTSHVDKKRFTFRSLSIASNFLRNHKPGEGLYAKNDLAIALSAKRRKSSVPD